MGASGCSLPVTLCCLGVKGALAACLVLACLTSVPPWAGLMLVAVACRLVPLQPTEWEAEQRAQLLFSTLGSRLQQLPSSVPGSQPLLQVRAGHR